MVFLPCPDIVLGFEEHNEDEDIPDDFLPYFELTYIGVMWGRSNNCRKAMTLFSIPYEEWSFQSGALHWMVKQNLFQKYRTMPSEYLEMYCIFEEVRNFNANKNATIRTRRWESYSQNYNNINYTKEKCLFIESRRYNHISPICCL